MPTKYYRKLTADTYALYRRSETDLDYSVIENALQANTITCEDTTVALDVNYSYIIRWTDSFGNTTAESNVACASLSAAVTARPGDSDKDGEVDTDNFTFFLCQLWRCDGQANFNADADGRITLVDYQTWYGYYLYQIPII